MRIAIIGRTRTLLETAYCLCKEGHTIGLVWTAQEEAYYKTSPIEFQQLAEEHTAPFINGVGINRPEKKTLLQNARCDIAVSINYPGIIKKDVLDIFPLGILNAHAGDLPRYRGNACPNWAILNGEEQLGLCIHVMSPELDAGPTLLRKYYPITPNTYVGELYHWIETIVPSLFVAAIQGLEHGTRTPQAQPSIRPLRVFPRKPEDSRISWNDSATAIHRLIRASSHPFAGAYTYLEKETKLAIWRAEIIQPNYDWCAIPGQVCFSLNGDPVIACGQDMIRIIEGTLEDTTDRTQTKQRILSSLRNRLS